MTSILIENYGGMIPRVSDRLLPPQAASSARNCKLLSGEIRGLSRPKFLFSLPVTTTRAFRIPDPPNTDVWVGFDNPEVDFIKGPLVNDAFDRYYWSDGSGPLQYNTLARLRDGDPAYQLGVPRPANAPTVAHTGGTTIEVTRAYVYTFVSTYGEEGPPSDPEIHTAPDDATWNLTGLDTTWTGGGNRDITQKRIYRTISDPNTSASDFFFVAQIPLGNATYDDTKDTFKVARNDTLESTSWFEPPSGLTGLVVMPNGYLAAFKGRDLYFSEPYRPHAWPPAYVQSAEFPIVGMTVVFGNLIIVTQGNPYAGTGVQPGSFSMTKHSTAVPGLSRRSVVPMPDGAYYASNDGIVSYGSRGVEIISRQLITRDKWNRKYSPTTIQAVRHNDQYVAFYNADNGFIFSFADPNTAFSELDRFRSVTTFQTDPWTGEAFLIRSGIVEQWDPFDTVPLSYQWVSKEFRFTKPINFAATKIELLPAIDPNATLEDIDPDLKAELELYNTERFNAGPLAPVNFNPVNGVTQVPLPTSTLPQLGGAVNGSALYRLNDAFPGQTFIQVNFYVRGKLLTSRSMESERMYRLPSGYTSSMFQVEFIGVNHVTHWAAAQSGQELAQV